MLTSSAVNGSLIYFGPSFLVIILQTKRTVIDMVDLAIPNVLATFLYLPSSDW